MLLHLDLFSGVGGFALAAKWVGGIQTNQFVEIDPFCQRVLAKNFPGVPIHGDITTFAVWEGQYDLITAGFPCQPHSQAGKKLASNDKRDLWPDLYRVICEVRPKWIVLENVRGLLSSESGSFFKRVLRELAAAGFDAEWGIVSCADLGGSHRRERIWIVAYSSGLRRLQPKAWNACSNCERDDSAPKQKRWSKHDAIESGGSALSYPNRIRCNGGGDHWGERPLFDHFKWHIPPSLAIGSELQFEPRALGEANADSPSGRLESGKQKTVNQSPLSQLKGYGCGPGREFTAQPTVRRGDDGVSTELDRVNRIKALGNAVVPQVAIVPLQRVLDLCKDYARSGV